MMGTLEGLYGACSEIEVALDCLFRKQGYRPAYADNSLAKIRAAIGDGLFRKLVDNSSAPTAEKALGPKLGWHPQTTDDNPIFSQSPAEKALREALAKEHQDFVSFTTDPFIAGEGREEALWAEHHRVNPDCPVCALLAHEAPKDEPVVPSSATLPTRLEMVQGSVRVLRQREDAIRDYCHDVHNWRLTGEEVATEVLRLLGKE